MGRIVDLGEVRKFVKDKFHELLPVSVWLPAYDRKLLKPDVMAGLTMAALSIPMLMAYAELAGLAPQYGLYAGIAATVAYFFFGTVRQMSIGPSSSQAILMASVVGVLAAGDENAYVALAGMAAILTGIIFFGARILKLGFILNLIPVSVFKGFLAGVGLTIIVGELPKLFGIPSTSGDFYTKLFYFLENLDAINYTTLGLGIFMALLLGYLGKRSPRIPSPLLIVILSILLMVVFNLEDNGVAIVGDIPSGLPSPSVPDVAYSDLTALVPLAFSLWIITFLDGMSVGKHFQDKYGYKTDTNQELVAYGASDMAAGLFQGFPGSGSFSRSMLNDAVGAKTQVAGIVSALLIAVVAMWLTGLFYYMPMVVLAVLIIWSVMSMVDFAELHRIRMFSNNEFGIAMVTLGLVLLLGVLEGVLVGVLISFVYVIYRISHPHIAILGRIRGTDQFKDVARHEENETFKEVLIVRVDAPIIFANSVTIKETILEMAETGEDIKLVIIDLQSSPILDITAVDTIKELNKSLEKEGIELRLAYPTGEAVDALVKSGLKRHEGPLGDKLSIAEIIDEFFTIAVVDYVEAEMEGQKETESSDNEEEAEEDEETKEVEESEA